MAGKNTVTVGSKLPFAITLRNPMNPEDTVVVRGLNGAPKGRNGVIMQLPYMTTEVSAEFWDAWYPLHSAGRRPFAPLANGSIFVASSYEEAAVVARDYEDEKTGLEGLDPKDYKVKTANFNE